MQAEGGMETITVTFTEVRTPHCTYAHHPRDVPALRNAFLHCIIVDQQLLAGPYSTVHTVCSLLCLVCTAGGIARGWDGGLR